MPGRAAQTLLPSPCRTAICSGEKLGQTIIFTRTRAEAARLHLMLSMTGFKCTSLRVRSMSWGWRRTGLALMTRVEHTGLGCFACVVGMAITLYCHVNSGWLLSACFPMQ
jgi:hypothetical protein